MKIKLALTSAPNLLLTVFFAFSFTLGSAQNDTLRVMVQNVLHFGDNCQGTQAFLDSQLKTIVKYTNSDLIGLDKMQAIKLTTSDPYGISPVWFADSIISQGLNAAYPGRYAYCALTDFSKASDQDMSILFYDKNKLGFLSVKPLYVGQEDFDLYKLFYKAPNLAFSHDTIFLYAIVCHTISGSSSSGRDGQATTVIDSLKKQFTILPNLIYMGDFNTHNSTEPGYKLITQTTDTSFLLYDPPFHPDNAVVYPIDWTTYPSKVASQLTVTTRQSTSVPNSCGNNGGGGFEWYDHILLSSPIINNYKGIRYIPGSWKVIGNDGKRIGISVNDSVTYGKNLSAPSSVLNAVWQFSDKYPVTVTLALNYNATTGIGSLEEQGNKNIKINNPVKDALTLHFSSTMLSEKAIMQLYDVCGRLLYSSSFTIDNTEITKNLNLAQGLYLLHIKAGDYTIVKRIVKD